jgi:tetratricopeptide (TPR) repeat protein
MAEVRHESPWADVAQVPPPGSLPLTGPDGTDVDGYPRRYVDRPALRSLLANREFPALTAAFERFQAEFEGDPRKELWVRDALESVGFPHRRERALLDAWVKASPQSFAPYLARARHSEECGFLYRGAKYAINTSEFEFRSMAEAFDQARRDAQRALELRPGLIEANALLIMVEIAGGDRRRAEHVLEDALRRCPSCYEIRADWVGWALLPRWGGSLEEMEAFAAHRSNPKNPRHRMLRGFVDFERAEEADQDDRSDVAIAAIDRACALGGDWRFLRERAALRRQRGDHVGRLADLNRADAARPGIPWVVFGRAWALADAQRWEEAGRDLLYVLRSEPTSSLGIWLQPRVVRALDVLGWKAHQEGRPADAARVYALARALAPADEKIAERSAAVARGGAPGALREGGPPASGDARPEVSVEALDAGGKPLAGARVVLASGGASWDALRRLEGGDASAARTDAVGRVRVPAQVGTSTVVVFAPGNSPRAVAVSVPLDATGARVRVALAAAESIEGRVLDASSRVVAGVEVHAIPDVNGLGSEPRAIAWTTTGPDGAFAIRDVDSGGYRLFVAGNGYIGPSENPTLGRVVKGGERGVALRASRERVLRGRVLLAESGKPPRPAKRFEVWGSPFGRRTFASPDGRFSAGFVMAPLGTPVTFSVEGRPPVGRTLDLTQDDNDAGDIIIGAGRTVKGTIFDPRGMPVPGAEIRLPTGLVLARSAGTGRFEVAVADGPVDIEFTHPRWRKAIRNVRADEDAVDVELPQGSKLKLLAISDDGEPVVGAAVSVILAGRPVACQTDANGRCDLAGLEDGQYWIVPRARERDGFAPATMYVRLDGTAERGVIIRWPRERTRLTVRVVDRDGKETRAAALVFPGAPGLSEAFDAKRDATIPHHVVPAGKPLENLAPDRYSVVAFDNWRKACAVAMVELKAGGEKEVTLRLDDGSCR